jgi:uncharacterized membrane protein
MAAALLSGRRLVVQTLLLALALLLRRWWGGDWGRSWTLHLARRGAAALTRGSWGAAARVVGALALGYALVMAAASLLRHAMFYTPAWDLGIYDQSVWSIASGRFPQRTLADMLPIFADHFNPILFGLAPLYWLWPDPRALLIVQAVVLATGAFPVYLMGRRVLDHRLLAVLFPLLYLAYYPLQRINLRDFHPEALAVTLLLLAADALLAGRRAAFLGWLALAMATKEEAVLTAVGFGLFILLDRRGRWLGSGLILAGTLIFGLILGLIIPHFRGGPYVYLAEYPRYAQFGYSFREILVAVITRPWRLVTTLFSADRAMAMARHLAPLGFLPLLSPLHLLPAVPTLAAHGLSSRRWQYMLADQYAATVIPFYFVGAVWGMRRFLRLAEARGWPRDVTIRLAAGGLLILSLLFVYRSPAWSVRLSLSDAARRPAKAAMVQAIPPTASVAADGPFLPHLSRRADIHLVTEVSLALRPQYVLLDLRKPTSDPDHRARVLERAFSDPAYRAVREEAGLVLLRRLD